MPTNYRNTGNLKKVLKVKAGARVMVTTNIDVSDGLMNGVMGSVAHVAIGKRTGDITLILVVFDNENVGQEVKCTSIYKYINENLAPIKNTGTISCPWENIFSGNKVRASLVLAWEITIHKYQGHTLPEIVVDMTPSKDN